MLNNKELFDLSQELLERMDVAKKEAKGLKMNDNDRLFPFVHVGDKEYVNPKYLSFEDHSKIVQLYKFVKENKMIGAEDLSAILNMNVRRFNVLIEVNNVVPNLVSEIRSHDDEKYISYLYFGLKQNHQKENNINI